MIPPERGHRVIELPYEVKADVVWEAAAGIDGQAYEVKGGIALEVPDGRGGGDSGGCSEEGEDGGELHFKWGCRLQFEYQSWIYTGLRGSVVQRDSQT